MSGLRNEANLLVAEDVTAKIRGANNALKNNNRAEAEYILGRRLTNDEIINNQISKPDQAVHYAKTTEKSVLKQILGELKDSSSHLKERMESALNDNAEKQRIKNEIIQKVKQASNISLPDSDDELDSGFNTPISRKPDPLGIPGISFGFTRPITPVIQRVKREEEEKKDAEPARYARIRN